MGYSSIIDGHITVHADHLTIPALDGLIDEWLTSSEWDDTITADYSPLTEVGDAEHNSDNRVARTITLASDGRLNNANYDDALTALCNALTTHGMTITDMLMNCAGEDIGEAWAYTYTDGILAVSHTPVWTNFTPLAGDSSERAADTVILDEDLIDSLETILDIQDSPADPDDHSQQGTSYEHFTLGLDLAAVSRNGLPTTQALHRKFLDSPTRRRAAREFYDSLHGTGAEGGDPQTGDRLLDEVLMYAANR